MIKKIFILSVLLISVGCSKSKNSGGSDENNDAVCMFQSLSYSQWESIIESLQQTDKYPVHVMGIRAKIENFTAKTTFRILNQNSNFDVPSAILTGDMHELVSFLLDSDTNEIKPTAEIDIYKIRHCQWEG